VTIVSVPPVQDGGSSAVDPEVVAARAADHDLVAVDAPEGLAVARAAEVQPDIRFGTERAVQEAAARGEDVLLLAVETAIPGYADSLREHNVSYEVIDPVEGV
jgi:putative transcriptional regulator